MSFHQAVVDELLKIAGMPKGMANVKTPYVNMRHLAHISGRGAAQSLSLSKKNFMNGNEPRAKAYAKMAISNSNLGRSLANSKREELKFMNKHDQFHSRISSKLPNWAAPRLN